MVKVTLTDSEGRSAWSFGATYAEAKEEAEVRFRDALGAGAVILRTTVERFTVEMYEGGPR